MNRKAAVKDTTFLKGTTKAIPFYGKGLESWVLKQGPHKHQSLMHGLLSSTGCLSAAGPHCNFAIFSKSWIFSLFSVSFNFPIKWQPSAEPRQRELLVMISQTWNRRGRCRHWNKFHWTATAALSLHRSLFSPVWTRSLQKAFRRNLPGVFLQVTRLLSATDKARDLLITFLSYAHFQNTTSKWFGRSTTIIIRRDNQKS